MNFSIPNGTRFRFLVLVTTALACGAGYWHFAKSTERLAIASKNLRECQQLATEIRRSQAAPQRALLETTSQEDLGGLVEKAASEASIGRDRLLRIDPQPAKRLGKSDYLEQATEVEILGVNLPQLVDFSFRFTDKDQLEVGTLRLRTPHQVQQTAEELWLAEIVLTQRIYAPTTK